MAESNPSGPRFAFLRPRFSIRSLLWATAAVAASFPAAWFVWFLLLNASTPWGAFAFWLTACILAGAVLIALNRTGGTRSYWAGFAVVGFVFFLLVPCQIGGDQLGLAPFERDQLLTTRLSRAAYAQYVLPTIPTAPYVPPAGMGARGFFPGATPPATGFAGSPMYSFVVGPNHPDSDNFVKVADLVWTLLFAFCGGWISLAIWATGPKDRSQGTSHDQPTK